MTVFLVGAGPGSADLLTVKAHRLISSAQVVVHDRLVSDEIMALIPANAERIDVGKRAGGSHTQVLINELLVTLGRNHQHVVRLKGGDPFVFGRGGEEAESLIKAGVSFEIVPGISSAFSVPAIAGIPVTHRRIARAVTVVTGHCEDPNESVDWSAHAKTGATLVVLMGTANLPKISADLLSAGMKPGTPVAIIHNGTRADQTISRLTLAEAHLEDAVLHLGADLFGLGGGLRRFGRGLLRGRCLGGRRFGACKNSGPEDYFGYYKWKEVANLYLDLAAQYPMRACVVRYEDLVSDRMNGCRQMLEFVGLDFAQQTQDATGQDAEGDVQCAATRRRWCVR